MDTQLVLNLMIQAVLMSFVALMIFDFIGGLWVVPLPPVGWQPPVIEQPTVSTIEPQPTPQQEILLSTPAVAFEEIPDPWTLQPQSPDHAVSVPAVIIPFPTLRLLPPAIAQKVQPTKPKRTKAKAKSDTSSKSASTPKRQSTKSRKITA
ncbi:hypothetical protein [Nostoc sp. MS1]|uniref:hypothetical protein n=1 Tax=Nostoc sp. MS1 TaxID=2764711 RepID=UPI001CC692B2|nr:hypothetical protein [Nostoc sp. MS1]BCL39881.1 hypothetical protein NSMS1_63280 [Nostoc sp. MS1]